MTWTDQSEASGAWGETDVTGLLDESGVRLLDESGRLLFPSQIDEWAAQSEASDTWTAV